jgi:hypothetical protein
MFTVWHEFDMFCCCYIAFQHMSIISITALCPHIFFPCPIFSVLDMLILLQSCTLWTLNIFCWNMLQILTASVLVTWHHLCTFQCVADFSAYPCFIYIENSLKWLFGKSLFHIVEWTPLFYFMHFLYATLDHTFCVLAFSLPCFMFLNSV